MQHDSFGSMVALQPYRTISCFDFAYLSHNCPELNLFKVQGLKEIMKIASPVINMHHLYAWKLHMLFVMDYETHYWYWLMELAWGNLVGVMEFTLSRIAALAKHNFVMWRRELSLVHCFLWFTCRSILVHQRLKQHNYFRINVSFLVLSCSFVFSVLSFSYMLQLQTYCGESKVLMAITFVHIFCIMMKCSSVVSFVCVSMFVHTLQLQ